MAEHHGTFHWNELMTRDPEQAKAFYAESVGWSYQPLEMEDGRTYWICMQQGQPVGGIMTMEGPAFDGMAENWMPYLAVDDIDLRVERARKAGAMIMRDPWEMPGIGRIAIIHEPGGAVVGWVTPESDPQALAKMFSEGARS